MLWPTGFEDGAGVYLTCPFDLNCSVSHLDLLDLLVSFSRNLILNPQCYTDSIKMENTPTTRKIC